MLSHASRSDAPLPSGRAYAGPPCHRRRLWLVVVLSCPICRGAHSHRSGDDRALLAGRVERACPVTGQLYRLNPVQRRREARRRPA